MIDRITQDAGVGDPDITDLHRRLANVLRFGTVDQVDMAGPIPRVRVRIGDPDAVDGQLVTAWLPYGAGRAAAGIRTFSAPEVGERVQVAAPGGDLRNGVVMPGALNTAAVPRPADARAGLHRVTFGDGTVVEYDAAAHELSVSVGAGKVKITGDVEITGDVTVTGSVNASADVTAAGTSLHTHVHGGVRSGGDLSGPPA